MNFLVIDDDPSARAMQQASGDMHCVPTLLKGLACLPRQPVTGVFVWRRTLGENWVEPCRGLVDRAQGAPVMLVLEDDDVISLRQAIESGISGAYYTDQFTDELVSYVATLWQPRVPHSERRAHAAPRALA